MTGELGRRNSFLACGILAAGIAGWGIATPTPARADISSDQASALQGQIRGWLQGLLGPGVPLSDNLLTVAPEGDHYRLSIPVEGDYGSAAAVSGDPLTALIKPIDANRWAVDEVRMPSPLRVENTGAGKDVIKSFTAKVAEQTTSGVIDLSFATTSSIDTMMRGYTSSTQGASGDKTTHVDRTVSHNTIQPAGDGRVNFLFDGGGEKLTSDSALPDGTPLKFSAGSFKVSGHADKVAPDQLGAAIKLATGMIPLAQEARAHAMATTKKETSSDDASTSDDSTDASAAEPRKPIPPAARASLHELARVMTNILGGIEENVALEQLNIQSDQFRGSLAHVSSSLGFGAPSGRLDMHMQFAMDGLDSPMIPKGVYHDYIPRHFRFSPRISGVPSQDVAQLINHAIDSDASNDDALQTEAMGLLSKGPLAIGIDELSFEMGPAALKSSGSLSISSPTDLSGQAQIRISGYDKLMQQANSRPELKQGAPVLIFLKGIGKQEGDAVIWNVTYQANTLLVNGTDLSSMMPGK